MSTIEILNITLTGGLLILGWFARELWGAVKTLKEDLVAFQNNVALFYVRKDDFRDFRLELLGVLQRIENKLDTKVDKS